MALYHEPLISKTLGYGMCYRGITQFYLPPTRLSTSGMNHTCLYFAATEHYHTSAGIHYRQSYFLFYGLYKCTDFITYLRFLYLSITVFSQVICLAA